MVKKKPSDFNAEDVDQMILLRFGQQVRSNVHPAFLSYAKIGQLFKVSANSVRSLILRRISEQASRRLGSSLAAEAKIESVPKANRMRFGLRYMNPEHISWLISAKTL